jgi:pimeloyl-ACP methyl ester carboxylesterase
MRSAASGVHVRLLAVASAATLLLVGCGDDGREQDRATRERSDATDVEFTSCDEAACTGEIDGAAFEILMPESWNGTLLLYSHGYRQAEAAPPDFEEPSTEPDPAPGWSGGDTRVADALLEQGYALAGSAYASNGWAVEDGVAAGEALHEYFVENVADPDRTYVWGDSLGGLITQLLAERNPDWVTGAAPLCGVLAGPTANLDLALDVSYATRTLLAPEMELTGYDSFDDAAASWQLAFDAVVAAGGDISTGVPRILLVAALADAPGRTATYDGSGVESQVRAKAESALTALGYSTYGRYDIEQRYGGNPSTNTGVDYAERVSEEERSLIDTVGGAGTTDALLAELAAGERLEADADARAAFAASGTPTGAVKDPTITLHTVADPLVLVQNETVFEQRAAANPDRTGDLVQLFSVPPAQYDEQEGAPYGAGHCNFSADERLGVIALLDGWARGGVYPAAGAVEAAMGQENGIEPNYQPPPWPAELDG